MSYVEWLRARGMLKITAIVLGALLVCAAILRVVLQHEIAKANINFTDVSSRATTHVEKLADGSTQTTIDDPAARKHVVITDHGWTNKHIEVTEPANIDAGAPRHASGLTFDMSKSVSGGMAHIVIDTGAAVDVANFFAASLLIGLIVATILAGPLAKENDGHLELSLLRPASREVLALRTFGTDIVAIAAAEVLGALTFLLAFSLFQIPSLTANWSSVPAIAAFLLTPIAWYAMLTAATASMKRGYGAIIGIAWPIALGIPGGALIQGSDNPLFVVFHAVMTALAAIDPLSYATFHAGNLFQPSNFSLQLGIVTLLTVVYFAIAIVQWRRVEA